MKVVKNYYRLMEIEKEFGLSHFDYIYLCEKFKNPIYFYVHHQMFLVGDDLNWSGEVHGVVYYKGLIRLERDDRIRLLRNSTVNIRQCYLDSRKGILSFKPIADIVTPDTLPKCWRLGNDSLKEQAETSIRAYTLPSQHLGHVAGNMAVENEIKLSYRRRNLLSKDLCSLQLNISDMVLTTDDVYWARGMLPSNENLDEQQDSLINNTVKERDNLFHLNLKKVIKAYPSKGGAKLWQLIYDGFHEENDDIDPYSILVEVSKSEIVWLDDKGNERTIMKASFQNLVSEIKNKK